jgi:hypothetical protein
MDQLNAEKKNEKKQGRYQKMVRPIMLLGKMVMSRFSPKPSLADTPTKKEVCQRRGTDPLPVCCIIN